MFLTDRFLNHSILLAGRKVFFGGRTSLWRPDFANRELIYRQMFESKNPRRVVELLKENHIDFVAIDDGIRNGDLIRDPNEYLYVRDFQKVYEDKEDRYRKLVIYKVPEAIPAGLPNMDLSEPGVTAFQGGHGRRQIRDLRQAGRLEREGIVRSHGAPQQSPRMLQGGGNRRLVRCDPCVSRRKQISVRSPRARR